MTAIEWIALWMLCASGAYFVWQGYLLYRFNRAYCYALATWGGIYFVVVLFYWKTRG